MASRRTTKPPSLKWDGTLYKPQTFGEGRKAGTVDTVQRQRQAREHAAHVRRVLADHEERKKRPAPFYLISWPFVLVRAIGKLVTRLGR